MNENHAIKLVPLFKKGNKIYIKKSNRGKFTEYCGGNVTQECIQRGKNSPDPKIRKRATFASNARKWKHQSGGVVGPHTSKIDIDTMMEEQNKNIWDNAAYDFYTAQSEKQKQAAKNNKIRGIVNTITNGAQKIGASIQQGIQTKKINKAIGEYNNATTALQTATTENNEQRANFEQLFKNPDGTINPIYKDVYGQYLNDPTQAQNLYNQYLQNNGPDNNQQYSFTENGALQAANNLTALQQRQDAAGSAFNQRFYKLMQLYGKDKALQILAEQEALLRSQKRGGKLKNKKRLLPNPHKPFGNVSILDDTGVINPRTLKLK